MLSRCRSTCCRSVFASLEHPCRGSMTKQLSMANRFGVLLHPDDVCWAAAEGVSETVIAAVLLLHERSVKEIAAELSAAELDQAIKLIGRSPRVYLPGTLDALKQRRALVSPERPRRSGETARSNVAAKKPHTVTRGANHAAARFGTTGSMSNRAQQSIDDGSMTAIRAVVDNG